MPTINDVALRAGVSKATVSNVLNRKGNVSEETAKRILKICEHMDYYPSFSASTILNRHTGIFGLFIYDDEESIFESELCSKLIEGLIISSAKVDMHLIIYYGIDAKKMRHIINGKGPIEGTILLRPTENDHRIDWFSQTQIQTVIIGTPIRSIPDNIHFIDVDNTEITSKIIGHLIHRGIEQVLLINSRADYSISQERNIGMYNTLKAKGLDTGRSMVVNITEPDESVNHIVTSFIQKHPEKSAVITTFSGSSEMIAQCEAVQTHKVPIFDYSRVSIDYKELGKTTFQTLYSALMNQPVKSGQIFPYHIDFSELC